MNTQICSYPKLTNKVIGFLLVLLAALALSSCSSKSRAEEASCSVDMDMRVTIDVTDVAPRVVFDQLATEPDCAITVSPFVTKHVTLHVKDATVTDVLAAACAQIECKYTFDGQHLHISNLNFIDKFVMREREEWQRKFEIRMPQGMAYEDATVSRVLEDISEVSGLEFKAWEREGDQTVSVDISGMTVDEALTAVVLQIEDGEGVALVKMWDGRSYGQHRLVDKP